VLVFFSLIGLPLTFSLPGVPWFNHFLSCLLDLVPIAPYVMSVLLLTHVATKALRLQVFCRHCCSCFSSFGPVDTNVLVWDFWLFALFPTIVLFFPV